MLKRTFGQRVSFVAVFDVVGDALCEFGSVPDGNNKRTEGLHTDVVTFQRIDIRREDEAASGHRLLNGHPAVQERKARIRNVTLGIRLGAEEPDRQRFALGALPEARGQRPVSIYAQLEPAALLMGHEPQAVEINPDSAVRFEPANEDRGLRRRLRHRLQFTGRGKEALVGAKVGLDAEPFLDERTVMDNAGGEPQRADGSTLLPLRNRKDVGHAVPC